MTYSNSDTALDALLGAVDDAVLSRLDEAADLDAGRAAVFASFTADAAPRHLLPLLDLEADAAESNEELCDPALGTGAFLTQAMDELEHNYQVFEIVKGLRSLAWGISTLREWLRKNGFDTRVQLRLSTQHGELCRLAETVTNRELELRDALFTLTKAASVLKRITAQVVKECERLDLDSSQFHARVANLSAEMNRVRSLMVRLFAGDDHSNRVPAPVQ
ncbi:MULTISPECIES: hypothetical protein [Streptomyces]|uniref:hypothetical protein n=1 Tax=Streptomyces TaxID=1883 RepID=UPI0033CF159D